MFARAFTWTVTAVMMLLIVRVVQLQTRPEASLAAKLGMQRSQRPQPARRGGIFDARRRHLAVSQTAVRLFADPKLIKDPPAFAQTVADTLGYDAATIEKVVTRRPDSHYVVIDPKLSEERLAPAMTLNLKGLGTQRWVERRYPQDHYAGQLLGAVGFDGQGLEGLEFLFQKELAGRSSSVSYLRDVRRRPLQVAGPDYQPPTDGADVQLSIDLVIQSIAEQVLADRCRRFEAEHGQMIVMDPRTGYILAMVNYPSFDPSQLEGSKPEQRRNRCVTDVFEPGSIFKPFVWAWATEHGLAYPAEIIDCTTSGVHRTSRGRRLRDVRPHGRITWQEVLVYSSNIGMSIVGERMGASTMFNGLCAFGFGGPTGSELPGESHGIVNPLDGWNHYSVTSVPMGQEVAVTALQLVRALCAIANDGLMATPTIRADRDALDDPILMRVLSKATARLTRSAMRRVVIEGTGRKANSDLYSIFGKTGTAQVPDLENGGYHDDQYVASFIAGAPVDDPRIVVGCFIHRPSKKSYYGGTVAAPGVMRVIERSLVYLGVAPQRSHENDGTI